MKFLPLILSTLWRKPLETLLVWLALTAAFTLFGLMAGVNVTARRIASAGPTDELIVARRYPDVPFTGLPTSVGEQLARLPGVKSVGSARWFNGYYKEPKNYAGIMMIDEGMHGLGPAATLTAQQWQQLFAARTGIVVSHKIAEHFNLKVGDRFTLITTNPAWSSTPNAPWPFDIIAIVADWDSRPRGFILGNGHFLDEALPIEQRGLGKAFWLWLDDPRSLRPLGRQVDRQFANSSTPTLSLAVDDEAHAAMNVGFDVGVTTWAIASAGLFMILFLTASAVARSVRERIPEFAVLETVGFRYGHIAALVVAEVAIPCVLGALLGPALAELLTARSLQRIAPNLSNNGLHPTISLETVLWGVACAALLATVSCTLPLLRLRKLSVTDALAGR